MNTSKNRQMWNPNQVFFSPIWILRSLILHSLLKTVNQRQAVKREEMGKQCEPHYRVTTWLLEAKASLLFALGEARRTEKKRPTKGDENKFKARKKPF